MQILPTFQLNRVLIHNPPDLRLIISEEVVMQPRLVVGILVLQAEGLICAIYKYDFEFCLNIIFFARQEVLIIIYV